MKGLRRGGTGRRRACLTKRSHATHDAADAELARMGREWGVAIWTKRIYPCRHCGGWHIGRKDLRR